MRRFQTFIALIVLCVQLFAQDRGLWNSLVSRLEAFGRTIPQEKVYVHMDNTCYFQGDTIWFTAYTRQTNTDKPSEVSGVLYAELLNNDGYLVERKLIEMKEGRGNGFFALNNHIQYSGFYELRAYTRWQLNWGEHEHKHPASLGYMFKDKETEREYFRDYDKLYSRVFPVYDRPLSPGDYTRDMTLRVMRRDYKNNPDKPELRLQFFPEGGNLIADVENRVAFEAAMTDGEQVEGVLYVGNERVRTVNRGRGTFCIIPKAGKETEVSFVAKNGERVTAKLPKPEDAGVAMQVVQSDDSVHICMNIAGLNADSLALTIMHEGKVEEWRVLSSLKAPSDFCPPSQAPQSLSPDLRLPFRGEKVASGFPLKGGLRGAEGPGQGTVHPGIHQVTVFDAQGRVFADRLFFVTQVGMSAPTLSVSGQKAECKPYEKVDLRIKGKAQGTPISLAVRDGNQSDSLFDNGNIMTEMLLSSEVKGFIPNPGWFFQKDDEEHRQALDLLLMTQGWRRFAWRDMAVNGAWELTQPNEKSPILMGNVSFNPNRVSYEVMQDNKGQVELRDYKYALELAKKKLTPTLLVHTELVHLYTNETAVSEAPYADGSFKIPLPKFYGNCVFFLSVADTAKWEKSKRDYSWIQMAGEGEEYPLRIMRKLDLDEADFRAYISWPYPRFVQPYGFYQTHLQPKSQAKGYDMPSELMADSTTMLREATVMARQRSRLKGFNYEAPAFIVDAYDAWNMIEDAGIPMFDYKNIGKPMVRVYLNDYGLNEERDGMGEDRIYTTLQRRALTEGMPIPDDSLYHPKYLKSLATDVTTGQPAKDSPLDYSEYFGGQRVKDPRFLIDKYVVYTDYQPRLEGSSRYSGADRPETRILIYPFYDDGHRAVYRDRRYIIDGFSYPTEFYSPDYSQQKPSAPTDYRRTLYWNPSLRLDENGEAHITLYNNSRHTTLQVDAQGQAADGTLLYNR